MVKKLTNHIKEVIKRDGKVVAFEKGKIEEAIYKALTATGEGGKKLSQEITKKTIILLNRRFKKGEAVNVEKIQDIIEEVLILENLTETAKAYILYREQRRQMREAQIATEEAVSLVDDYLNGQDWQIKENSNMAFSLQGLNHYVASYVAKKYWLNRVYPPEIRRANEEGDFHLHNLDTIGAYCMGWDLEDLLMRGFGGVAGKIQSKPAKHFRAALGQIVNFFYTLQGESAGAQAFSNFDTLLAPFIRYDNLTYQEVKQALQEFLFNMNVPTRVGFQTPFTNITLDLKVPEYFKSNPVIIGGQTQKETYAEFQKEMDILNQALTEVYTEGDATGRVFTFPIPTYNITKDFDWNNLAYEGIWRMTAKYGIPYFSNFINSEMQPEDARSMCKLPSCQIIYRNAEGKIAKTEIRRIVDDFMQRGNQIEVLINGKFEPVTNVTKIKLENEDILKINLDNGIIDKMTLDHPSLIIKNGKLEMVESKNLKVGDEFPIAKYPYEGELGDFDAGRLVGLYIGDGWISHDGATLNYVFGNKEKDLINFIQKICEKRFVAPITVFLNGQHKYCRISIASRALVELIKEYVRGDHSLNKRLNSEIYGRSIEFRKGVLVGLIESDGFIKRGVIVHLGNKKLILDNLILARSLGVNTTYFESKNRTREKNKIAYTLRFSVDYPDWLANYFKLKRGKNLKYRDYEDFYGIKIVKIEKVKYTGYVYDFEIDSKDHSFQLANGIITHNCCRLRLDNRELYKRGGGLFGANPLTGSIGVVTINLSRIGYLSKTKKEFFEKLTYLMDLAKNSLKIKRKVLEDWTEKGLYPYSKYYLEAVKKMRGVYWGNHFSTIGLIGMNEALLNFLGVNIGETKGIKFTEEVMDFMRDKLIEYQEETGNLYNLEATPAEGTSYRLALKDKKKYPEIITAGEKEPFYTNSTQLPVNYTDDLFEALKLQDLLQTKYTGGCIEKGNKVLTNKGLIKIEEIAENFGKLKPIKALSYNLEKGISEWDQIIDAMKVDVKKHNKIRIKGEGSLDITTSDWHPFFVLERIKPNPHCPACQETVNNIRGFAVHLRYHPECRIKYSKMSKYQVVKKRADELKKGDYILQNSFNLYPNTESKLNDDLMWLIGFFIGDGSISRFFDNRGGNHLEKFVARFFSEHQEALEKVKRILNNYFNTQVNIISDDKRSKLLKCVSTSKKDVCQFFFKYGFSFGEKTYKVAIPHIVKKNINQENVYSLLSGLADSDGHFGKRDGDFEYYTVSEKLADDILEICNIAGIKISKKFKKTKRKNEANIYRLRIPQYEVTKLMERLTSTFNLFRIKRELSNRKKRHLPVLRVKEVSKADVKDNFFYDLTTQKNHNYLAGENSLVFIHNTVFHAFLGESISDTKSVRSLIKIIFERFHLPYFTLTPTFSICPVHGYLLGEHFTCPKCTIEQPCEVYSRVVGYLRPVQQWHYGKQEEFRQRKTFKI